MQRRPTKSADDRAQADAIVRAVRSLAEPSLRASYVTSLLQEAPLPALARALDRVCTRAEQAEEPAREALVAIVDALTSAGVAAFVQRLREEVAGESLLALERLIRQPLVPVRPSQVPQAIEEDRPPDYGRGRPLTLGERKALARRPNRETLERLFLDPHPHVIRGLLRNPRVTEDDVVRLASRRPNSEGILTEIARSTRWIHRARVRMAVTLNPDTPIDISGPITGLLVRPELRLVAESTHVPAPIRALCLEHLQRRPPGSPGDDGGTLQ